MKQLNGYNEAKPYTENERLPIGGYVLKIKDVRYEEGRNGNNDVIVLAFDIAEGEQAGFYQRNYENQIQEDKKWKGTYRLYVPKDDGTEQDNWTMRKFKTAICAFEESNSGYHWNWDQQTLKGKTVGALFNNKEYEFDGRNGFYTRCHSLISAERIRKGKFRIPEDTLLKTKAEPSVSVPGSDGFINIPDGLDEELPF